MENKTLEKGTMVKVLDIADVRMANDISRVIGIEPLKIGGIGEIIDINSKNTVGADWYVVKFDNFENEISIPDTWFEVVEEPKKELVDGVKSLAITYNPLIEEWTFESNVDLKEELEVDEYVLDNTLDTLFRLLGLI